MGVLLGYFIFIIVLGAGICKLLKFNGCVAKLFFVSFKQLVILFFSAVASAALTMLLNLPAVVSFFLFGLFYILFLILPKKLKESSLVKKYDSFDSFLNKAIEAFILFIVLCYFIVDIFDIRFFPTPVEQNALSILPETEKELNAQGYIKTLNTFGLDVIKKSNKLVPLAAQRVADEKKCDTITNVMLSTLRSNKNQLYIVVDCRDETRFILSEAEIKGKEEIKSLKEKMKENIISLLSDCEAQIKANLTHPASYQKIKTHYDISNYATFVDVLFSAKNGLGLPLEYIGHCVYDDEKRVDFGLEQ